MNKKICFFLLAFTFLLPSMAQQIDKADVLKEVSTLVNNKEHLQCIQKVDEFERNYKGEKDSLYVAILYQRAFSYCALGKQAEGAETLQTCIDIYKAFNKEDWMMHYLYWKYCRVASTELPRYLQNLHALMKCKYWKYSDYFVYEKKVCDYGGVVWRMSSPEREKFLAEEEKELKGLNKVGFEAFFLYMKGKVIMSKYGSDYMQLTAEDGYCEQGVNYLSKARVKFKELIDGYDNPVLAFLYFETLDELIDHCEMYMEYLTVAHYRKTQLELSAKYWKKWNEWGFSNPWEYKYNGADSYQILHSYVEDLEKIDNYKAIVSTLQQVKKSEEWNLLDESEKEYVETTLSDAISKVSNTRSTTNGSAEDAGRSWNLDNEYGKACAEIEQLLKNNASDAEIIKIIESVRKNVLKKNSTAWYQNFEDWYSILSNELLDEYGRTEIIKYIYDGFEGMNAAYDYVANGNGDISTFKGLIDEYRGSWHLSMGLMNGLKSWEWFEHLSRAYVAQNKYPQAIRAQEIACEILRSDRSSPEWQDEDKEYIDTINTFRDRMYVGEARNPWVMNQTIEPEIEAYLRMSDLYLESGNYEKQYEYLAKAFEASNIIVCYDLNIGTDSHADNVVRNRWYVYNYIMRHLPIAIEKYPKFAELALRAAYMRQGFMLNQNNVIYQDVLPDTNEKASIFYKMSKIFRSVIEDDLTEYGEIQGEKQIYYENALYNLNKIHPVRFVHQNSIVDFDFIKNNLKDGEVFVDFFTLYVDTVYAYEIPSLKEEKWRAERGGITYAIITRNNWDTPKVVEIGRNHGKGMLSGDWNLEQYQFTDSVARISELHNDVNFGRYCWGKIIEAAELKPQENIIFVPSDFLHHYAIEYLPINNSQRMSDLYGMYRISSAIELKNRGVALAEDDRVAVLGDLNYTGKVRTTPVDDKQMKNRKKIGKNKKQQEEIFLNTRKTSSTLELTDREKLDTLAGGHKEIDSIGKIFGAKCTMYTNLAGTKKALANMDWESPAVLHISTHGFNLNYTDLDSTEHQVLFGKRDTIYDDAERSMFETGLYLSKPSSKNLKDGIITAKEISMLNLNNTKLVVLSACASATGTANNTGVYGLTRGFKVAGVKAVLGSLWPVDDNATSILMASFYKFMKQGNDAYTSLLKAQEAVRNYEVEDVHYIGSNNIYADPYYWAGFILVDGL